MLEHKNFDYINNLISIRNTNKRINKYYGFVIWDSFNNPILPISYPKYDENDFYFSEYQKRFYRAYSKKEIDFLPWHFFIEFINNKYIIYSTRPYNYMFPLNSAECINTITSNNVEVETDIFKKIDVEDYMHILILGDSNADIYTSDIYFKIGKFIISAYRQFFYNRNVNVDNELYSISVGSNFNMNSLRKHI